MDFQNRAFLNTREAARFLTDRGLPTSPATLDTKRTRGGGPRFRRYGPRIIYEPPELREWAHSCLSEPLENTSVAKLQPKPAPSIEGSSEMARLSDASCFGNRPSPDSCEN
jgi:hypothetical protein